MVIWLLSLGEYMQERCSARDKRQDAAEVEEKEAWMLLGAAEVRNRLLLFG
jgi:hypothetical protein